MDREELEELRQFASDMEGVLENVDLLLSLAEAEDDLPFERRHTWRAEYRHVVNNAPVIQMPQPVSKWYSHSVIEHRAVNFMAGVQISDKELLLRRTPAEMQELVARVGSDVQIKLQKYIARIGREPSLRAKIYDQALKG